MLDIQLTTFKMKHNFILLTEKSCETWRCLNVRNLFSGQLGFGSSNDGNTSRRIFSDIKFASAVTGVDEEIIQRFSIILSAINASVKIDAEKFGEYAFTTARKFNTKHAWYSFSRTVDKVLVHGADMIKKAILQLVI